MTQTSRELRLSESFMRADAGYFYAVSDKQNLLVPAVLIIPSTAIPDLTTPDTFSSSHADL